MFHVQYDCRDARKGVEIFVRDLPGLLLSFITVFLLQWSLAPQWLPALALVIGPNLVLTFVLGWPIRHANRGMFDAVAGVAECVPSDRRGGLRTKQSVLHRWLWRREAWMGLSEVLMQLTIWGGGLLVVLYWYHRYGTSGPQGLNLGSLALFIANLKFLSKPVMELGKTYNKYWSVEPALRRALDPACANS